MDLTTRTKYESFPNKTLSYWDKEDKLEYNEPASAEFQTWMKTVQAVPRGVIARKLEEDEHARQIADELAKQHEEELLAQARELEAWMPDELCKTCFKCEETFTLIKRRHHCRICGLVFCGNCSSHFVPGQSFGFGNLQVRACDDCFEIRSKKFDVAKEGVLGKLSKVRSSKKLLALVEDAPQNQEDQHEAILSDDDDPDELDSIKSPHSESDDAEVSSVVEEESDVPNQQPVSEPPSRISVTGELSSRDRPRLQAHGDQFQSTPSTLSIAQRTAIALRKREESLMYRLVCQLEQDSVWRDVLISLCREACDTVRPDPVLAGDSLDFTEYVRIQIIPGSRPTSSSKINGVVLRRNLIDRFMPKSKLRPRILLLKSGIELNKDASRIVSFDKLFEQEALYLEVVVKKICSIGADVVLVGGSVAAVAQKLLRHKDIAVASQVPLRDLEWVSRLTGAMILPTTEYINRNVDPTGTCSSWRCETLYIGPMALLEPEEQNHPSHRANVHLDTFMFFEGCIAERGCTLCLRGSRFVDLEQKAKTLVNLLKRQATIRTDHAFMSSMDGDEAIGKGETKIYGSFDIADDNFRSTDGPELHVLCSDTVEVGRVWLQNGMQQHSLPETSIRAFYGPRDRAFGDFLLRYCFDHNKLNNNMADGNFSMVFLHGHGRLRVSAERLAKADAFEFTQLKVGSDVDENLRILTWGVCKICSEHAAVKCMDPIALRVSFAKWLQNVFYMEGLLSSSRSCEHSLMHDYHRFFFKGDFVVCVEYDRSVPLDFVCLERLNFVETEWYSHYAEQLLEDLKGACEEALATFTNAPSLRTQLVEERIRQILSEAEQLKIETERFSPSTMNRLLRDLFLSCMEWNSQILNPKPDPLPLSLAPPPLQSPRSQNQTNAGSLRSFNSSSLDPSNPRPRFSNLSSEPRLQRRPSLPEIREARQRVLGARLSNLSAIKDESINNEAEINRSTMENQNDLPSPSEGVVPAHRSSAATLPMNLSSSSSLSTLVTRSAPPHQSTPPSARKQRAVPLPVRLTEGHLLLPPGRRLFNAVTQVRELEPTSWIAHALCSDEYASKLNQIIGSNSDWVRILISLSRSTSGAGLGDEPSVKFDEAMHINCGFTDASEYSARQCAFSVKSFYAPQFHALRMLYSQKGSAGLDDRLLERRFIESLSRCNTWKPTGGKSRATFLKTLDDRFIVKSVSQEEFEMFQELAPKYFAHLANVLGPNRVPSLLVPFLGLYSVTMQSEVVIGHRRNRDQQANIHKKLLVVVSPNIFWKSAPKVTYDLKGSTSKRLVRNPEQGAVRLDTNFTQDQRGVPLPLKPRAKEILSLAVNNDAAFLASAGVVDYSLLVGVCEDSINAGIIDYLQLYNYKKMFESTVKKAAGQVEPTVVSPRKYQARFVASMDRYFLSSGHPLLVPQNVEDESEEAIKLLNLDEVE